MARHSQCAGARKASPVDAVIEGSRWPLTASLSGACHSATADTWQDALPHACASLSSSPACEAVVTAPPEALLTAWSDCDCHTVCCHRSLYYHPRRHLHMGDRDSSGITGAYLIYQHVVPDPNI